MKDYKKKKSPIGGGYMLSYVIPMIAAIIVGFCLWLLRI